MSGSLRRKSRELLIFFLLHPQGVGRGQALEALWPETDPDQAAEKFWAQLGDIRSSLRHEYNPTAKFVDKSGDIYRVEPADIDVDVWRFDRFLAQADKGDGVREALNGAVDLYRGELLEGIYYEWASELRDHFRGRLMDALAKLAEACESDGDIEEVTRVLARAISLEPYAEHMYRQLMIAYGKLGRATDITRVYRELEAALSDGLDAEPTEKTAALKSKLVRELSQGTEVFVSMRDFLDPSHIEDHAGEVIASELMTSPALACRASSFFEEVAEGLVDGDISGMPVVDDSGRLVGVISERDLAHALGGPLVKLAVRRLSKGSSVRAGDIPRPSLRVKDIMTTQVISATPDTPAMELAALVVANEISRILIVRDSELIGVVTRGDLLAHFAGAPPKPRHADSLVVVGTDARSPRPSFDWGPHGHTQGSVRPSSSRSEAHNMG